MLKVKGSTLKDCRKKQREHRFLPYGEKPNLFPTREERKLEAIMKAFDRMDRDRARKAENQTRQKRKTPRKEAPPPSPSGAERGQAAPQIQHDGSADKQPKRRRRRKRGALTAKWCRRQVGGRQRDPDSASEDEPVLHNGKLRAPFAFYKHQCTEPLPRRPPATNNAEVGRDAVARRIAMPAPRGCAWESARLAAALRGCGTTLQRTLAAFRQRMAALEHDLDDGHADNEYKDYKFADNGFADSEFTDNEHTNNKHADNEFADNEFSDNEFSDNEHADNEFADNEFADNEFSDNEHADNKFADNEFADHKHANNEHVDSKFADNKHADSKQADNKHSQQTDATVTGHEEYAGASDAIALDLLAKQCTAATHPVSLNHNRGWNPSEISLGDVRSLREFPDVGSLEM